MSPDDARGFARRERRANTITIGSRFILASPRLPRFAPAVFAVFLLGCAAAVAAAPRVAPFVVRTDLAPLIRAAASSSVQFAVPVPHAASSAASGQWSVADGTATWRYAVQVPGAVSLSFHAQGSLPAGATLLVSGGEVTTSYGATALHHGELWSRIHAGDTLELTLTVAAADRAAVDLRIGSLQAGYRSIGAGVEDHPVYRQLLPVAPPDDTACVTNYECAVTAGNTPPAAATVALVIENLYQCTGTLVNDVPGDNTPYVLTARHCETGQLGGGNPQAAAGVTVYWNATSACGTPLGSIYDGTLPTQTGARTVVEQQDAWLIVLDDQPVAADAQFAGFDASGGAVTGGYSIHHAGGRDKQLVGWYGTAYVFAQAGELGTAYTSDLLETVNQSGNIGGGASGSALFDRSDHLVGTLALGRKTADPSGYQSCPVAQPSPPNGTNGAADFTALAAVWDSTADTTSSTGGVTLSSVLDPQRTGSRVVPGKPIELATYPGATPPAPRITFTPATVAANQAFSAVWSGGNAANCTLTGGIPGGSWGGTMQNVPASGTAPETGPAGTYTFGLICQSTQADGAAVSTQATLTITSGTASAPTGSSADAAAQGIESNSGGGGSMGIFETVILAALVAFAVTRRTATGRRWRLPGLLRPLRRRIRQQERTPRGH
jgi:lysyl endopeptidase